MVVWAAALPILKGVGTFLGGASSALGIGGSLMGLFGGNSARKSYEYSWNLLGRQYELERESRKNAYQDTRYSLEQAGYNPMLAMGSQAQGLPVGGSMNVTDPSVERLTSAMTMMSTMSDLALKVAQIRNINKDTELKPFDKPLKTLGDIINKVDKKTGKQILGEIVGSSNTPTSAMSTFGNKHPTIKRALKKISNGDFKGAGYELGMRMSQKYKSRNSAKSIPKGMDLNDWAGDFDSLPVW